MFISLENQRGRFLFDILKVLSLARQVVELAANAFELTAICITQH
jgi:hypothetical protein